MVPPLSSLQSAAVDLAESGFWVFLLSPRSKIPTAGSRGFKDATNDPAIVAARWQSAPYANVGIACEASGLDIIDVDAQHDGLASFARLEERYGVFTAPRCATPNGGWHSYFTALDGGLTSREEAFGPEFPGIDIKSRGGYVVAPPSVHPNGGTYRWDIDHQHPLAPMPEVWRNAALAIDAANAKPAKSTRTDPTLEWGSAQETPSRVEERRASYDTPVSGKIRPGMRRDKLFRLACMVRDKGVSESGLRAMLRAENLERCAPPLPESEISLLARDVATRYRPAHDVFGQA